MIDATRYLLGAYRPLQDELAHEPEEVRQHLPEHDTPEDFNVLPENWDATQLYQQCDTQWNWVSGFSKSVKTGLNYAGVDVVMAKNKYKDSVFKQVQVMERVALNYWAKQRD